MASESNRVHQGATVYLALFVIKKITSTALTARQFLNSGLAHGTVREFRLIFYVQVVNYLFKTYVANV